MKGFGVVCGTKAFSHFFQTDPPEQKASTRVGPFAFFQNCLNGHVAYCDTGPSAGKGSPKVAPSLRSPTLSDLQKNMEAMLDGSANRYDPETGEDSDALDADEDAADEYSIGNENISEYIRKQIDDDDADSPTLSKDWDRSTLSNQVDYLIVGAGVAAQAAISSILKLDPAAKILVVGESRGADGTQSFLRAQCAPFLNDPVGGTQPLAVSPATEEGPGVLSARVVDININLQVAMLSNGQVVKYKKSVLLASGAKEHHHLAPADSRARKLVCGIRSQGDRDRMRTVVSSWNGRTRKKHITVVGGGLVGVQSAYHLVDNVMGRNPRFPRVSLVFAERAPLARYLPRYLANVVASRMEKAGILLSSYSVVQYIAPIMSADDGLVPGSGDAEEAEIFFCRTYDTQLTGSFGTNLVVFAPTHLPAVTSFLHKDRDLALEEDPVFGGIVANSELCAATGVYVAGDALSFPSRLGRRRVQWSVDHAAQTGKVAGTNMAVCAGEAPAAKGNASPARYVNEPVTRVKISGTNFAFLGVCSSSLETGCVWRMKSSPASPVRAGGRKAQISSCTSVMGNMELGFVVYVRGDEIVGLMMWDKDDPSSSKGDREWDGRIERAKAYLSMTAEDRMIRLNHSPHAFNSRSMDVMNFIMVVGEYVLGQRVASPADGGKFHRRWEASREARVGMKERRLRTTPKDEVLYFSQGRHARGGWRASKNGLSSTSNMKSKQWTFKSLDSDALIWGKSKSSTS